MTTPIDWKLTIDPAVYAIFMLEDRLPHGLFTARRRTYRLQTRFQVVIVAMSGDILNDAANCFAILPALVLGGYSGFVANNVSALERLESSFLSVVIFTALLIVALILLARRRMRDAPPSILALPTGLAYPTVVGCNNASAGAVTIVSTSVDPMETTTERTECWLRHSGETVVSQGAVIAWEVPRDRSR